MNENTKSFFFYIPILVQIILIRNLLIWSPIQFVFESDFFVFLKLFLLDFSAFIISYLYIKTKKIVYKKFKIIDF